MPPRKRKSGRQGIKHRQATNRNLVQPRQVSPCRRCGLLLLPETQGGTDFPARCFAPSARGKKLKGTGHFALVPLSFLPRWIHRFYEEKPLLLSCFKAHCQACRYQGLVPKGRLELPQGRPRRILSPLRLPFRHSGNGHFFIIKPLFRPVARPRLPPIQTNGRKPPTFLPHAGLRYLSTSSSYTGIDSGTRTVARRTYASGNARRASSRFSFDGAFRYASMTTHQPGFSPWKPSLR